jgi:galactokinase
MLHANSPSRCETPAKTGKTIAAGTVCYTFVAGCFDRTFLLKFTLAMISIESLRKQFRSEFGGEPQVFCAPGRVNLIGEHVDYSEGIVLPLAINRTCYALAQPRRDRRLRIRSIQFDQTVEYAVNDSHRNTQEWAAYVRGVAWALEQSGDHITGADILVSSDVPLGAGLSSSAALEVSSAFALLAISGRHKDLTTIARLCQRAENEYVGMRCGIMDQIVACFGKRDHAILIDCRTLEATPVPLDGAKVRVVVANTMAKHALVSSEYNRRRAECEEAVRRIRARKPSVRTLRDVTWAEIEAEAADWPAPIRHRARHVTTEIARVEAAAIALQAGRYEEVGRLMAASHESLDLDFQVSCAELNTMVSLANELPGCIGARMTGGGFGGCTVNLVWANQAESFAKELAQRYKQATSVQPDVYVCEPSDGARQIR